MVNPIAVLPVFLAVTAGFDAAKQRRVAHVAVLASFCVLLLFIIGGGFVLEKVGISLRSFQIAGGIILFLVGLDMVRGVSYVPAGGTGTRPPTSPSIRSRSRRSPGPARC